MRSSPPLVGYLSSALLLLQAICLLQHIYSPYTGAVTHVLSCLCLPDKLFMSSTPWVCSTPGREASQIKPHCWARLWGRLSAFKSPSSVCLPACLPAAATCACVHNSFQSPIVHVKAVCCLLHTLPSLEYCSLWHICDGASVISLLPAYTNSACEVEFGFSVHGAGRRCMWRLAHKWVEGSRGIPSVADRRGGTIDT